ncbi:MAG: GNAT family N-acetyltransferase [Chloroflexi bacterium]|nr:GNAT family N-acetyltransferase [Chloroflexota bacterium]
MIRQRPYTENDLEPVLNLLLTYRGAGFVNRYPTVWRLKLLMSSRLWDKSRDAAVWENGQGDIIAFAMLSKRHAASTAYGLERVIHPAQNRVEVTEAILDWSDQRLTEIAREQRTALTVGVAPFEQESNQDVALLENRGFTLILTGYNVYMGCGLDGVIKTAKLPNRFEIEPLAASELEEYQTLYGFAAVLMEHQKALIYHPQYQHFVVKNPEGKMVAYLECSITREEWIRSRQYIGWIDYIETHADYQGKGLGLALMQTALQHLRAHGATQAMLITTNDNTAAQHLYRKVGMEITAEERVYGKTIDLKE